MSTKKSKDQIKDQEANDSYSDESDQESDNEITKKEFEKMLKKQREQEEQKYNTKKWGDLKINKIYTIIDYKTVNTRVGKSFVLSLKNNGNVWCPQYLAKKINKEKPPIYVRPLGLQTCYNNPKNKYYAFDLLLKK